MMKKEVVMILCIITIVIIGHVVTQNYTKKFFNEIESDLKNLKESFLDDEDNNNNKENLKASIDAIKAKWESKYDMLAYYIEHDELEKVSTQIVSVSSYIDVENFEDGVVEVDKCIFLLEHIRDKEALQLVNIF